MTVSLRMQLAQLERDRAYSLQLTQVTGAVSATILLAYGWEVAAADWFVYDAGAIAAATGLARTEQDLARRQLRLRGFLRERLEGEQLYLQLDADAIAQQLTLTQQLLPAAPTPPPAPECDRFFGVQKTQTQKATVTPAYQFLGPWASEAQLAEFQVALWQYFLEQGQENPGGIIFRIIDGLTKGILSPFWQDFVQGRPLGTSLQVQREWEIAPGQPYPAFEEDRIQYYCHQGEPIDVATAKARAELRRPQRARDLWAGFLRKCDRLADDAIRAQKQGLQQPYLPPNFAPMKTPNKAEIFAKLSALQTPLPLNASESAKPPKIEVLRQIYRSSLGKSIVRQQLQKHPEWGYQIVDDEIVDLYPF